MTDIVEQVIDTFVKDVKGHLRLQVAVWIKRGLSAEMIRARAAMLSCTVKETLMDSIIASEKEVLNKKEELREMKKVVLAARRRNETYGALYPHFTSGHGSAAQLEENLRTQLEDLDIEYVFLPLIANYKEELATMFTFCGIVEEMQAVVGTQKCLDSYSKKVDSTKAFMEENRVVLTKLNRLRTLESTALKVNNELLEFGFNRELTVQSEGIKEEICSIQKFVSQKKYNGVKINGRTLKQILKDREDRAMGMQIKLKELLSTTLMDGTITNFDMNLSSTSEESIPPTAGTSRGRKGAGQVNAAGGFGLCQFPYCREKNQNEVCICDTCGEGFCGRHQSEHICED